MQRDFNCKNMLYLGRQLHSQERISIQLKKVIVDAYLSDPQQLLPDLGDAPLEVPVGSDIRCPQFRPWVEHCRAASRGFCAGNFLQKLPLRYCADLLDEGR